MLQSKFHQSREFESICEKWSSLTGIPSVCKKQLWPIRTENSKRSDNKIKANHKNWFWWKENNINKNIINK